MFSKGTNFFVKGPIFLQRDQPKGTNFFGIGTNFFSIGTNFFPKGPIIGPFAVKGPMIGPLVGPFTPFLGQKLVPLQKSQAKGTNF